MRTIILYMLLVTVATAGHAQEMALVKTAQQCTDWLYQYASGNRPPDYAIAYSRLDANGIEYVALFTLAKMPGQTLTEVSFCQVGQNILHQAPWSYPLKVIEQSPQVTIWQYKTASCELTFRQSPDFGLADVMRSRAASCGFQDFNGIYKQIWYSTAK